MPTKRPLYCPNCGSNWLKSIGSNGIEPSAGYTCQYCSQKLRKRGSGWLYVFLLGFGLVMGPVGIGLLIFGFIGGAVQFFVLGGIGLIGGLICFVYAVIRLTHPVPLLERPRLDYRPPPTPQRPQLDYRPPATPQPAPEPTKQMVPEEQPEMTVPVWRVSGVLERTGATVVHEIEAESDVDAASVAELNGVTVTQVELVT